MGEVVNRTRTDLSEFLAVKEPRRFNRKRTRLHAEPVLDVRFFCDSLHALVDAPDGEDPGVFTGALVGKLKSAGFKAHGPKMCPNQPRRRAIGISIGGLDDDRLAILAAILPNNSQVSKFEIAFDVIGIDPHEAAKVILAQMYLKGDRVAKMIKTHWNVTYWDRSGRPKVFAWYESKESKLDRSGPKVAHAEVRFRGLALKRVMSGQKSLEQALKVASNTKLLEEEFSKNVMLAPEPMLEMFGEYEVMQAVDAFHEIPRRSFEPQPNELVESSAQAVAMKVLADRGKPALVIGGVPANRENLLNLLRVPPNPALATVIGDG